MPTKRTFDLIVITTLALRVAWALPKLWAARHAPSGGVDGLAGQVILVGS